MSLTKEECKKALSDIKMLGGIYIPLEALDTVDKLIKLHFDNPPLKFEELKENMVVWDNKRKMFIKIFDTATLEENCFSFEVFGWEVPIYDEQFEENRFYLKEVKE